MAVAVHSGYFDDSWDGKSKIVCSLGGYVATVTGWRDQFEPGWESALKTHGVPWLHMNEFSEPDGKYAKWYCVENDPEKERKEREKIQFLSACAHVIGTAGLKGFGATVRVADVARFNREKNQNLDVNALAIYGAALDIRLQFGKEPMELFFDQAGKTGRKTSLAEEYIETDNFYPGLNDGLQLRPLQKCFTFRNLRPLQAADFAAYELRKSYEKVHDWFEIEDKPFEWEPRFQHFAKWSLEKFHSYPPPSRKSFVRLKTMAHIEGIVWDYRALCIAHEARGGVWS
jgi:hypothetical protein